jgi:hypothetical protein
VDPLIFEEPPKQFQRRVLVATLLHQDVQDFSLVIDRAGFVSPNFRSGVMDSI